MNSHRKHTQEFQYILKFFSSNFAKNYAQNRLQRLSIILSFLENSREDKKFRKIPSYESFVISLNSLCVVLRYFPRTYKNWQIIFRIQLLFLKAANNSNTIYKITPSENNKTALGNLESLSVFQKVNQLCQDQTTTCHLLFATCCSK